MIAKTAVQLLLKERAVQARICCNPAGESKAGGAEQQLTANQNLEQKLDDGAMNRLIE
ncbi:hypothetical protein HUU40_18030 [candidate division KSB1 bacterium]|nr:hypothetical protein [candidate division KSB1 bacterium]